MPQVPFTVDAAAILIDESQPDSRVRSLLNLGRLAAAADIARALSEAHTEYTACIEEIADSVFDDDGEPLPETSAAVQEAAELQLAALESDSELLTEVLIMLDNFQFDLCLKFMREHAADDRLPVGGRDVDSILRHVGVRRTIRESAIRNAAHASRSQ